jgi:hypothetical protein
VFELKAMPGRGDPVAGQQPPHDLELALEQVRPSVGHPECCVLDWPVADPHTEDKPARCDRVQRGRVLCHLDRVEQGQ